MTAFRAPVSRRVLHASPTRRSPRRHQQRRRRRPHPPMHPAYAAGSRRARFADTLFLASDLSSSTEEQSEDDEVPWARTLCVALVAFAAALLVGTVALVIVSRGVPTEQRRSVGYEHLLRAPAVAAPAWQVKGGRLVGAFDDKPRLQRVPHAPAVAAIEGVDARKPTDFNSDILRSNKNRYRCIAVFYKFCATPKREYFFSRAANACVPVGAMPGVQLCNHGANRYASMDDCSLQCVRTPHQSRRCFQTALFTTCSSDDMVNGSSTWFFDGTGCRMWQFPLGQCPSLDGDLFASRELCTTRCLSRVVANSDLVGAESGNSIFTRDPTVCRVPRPSVCTSQQRRFPVFFQRAVDPGSSPRCQPATLVGDTGHRCLAGTNKFRSQNECESVCVHGV
ncbi:uncharacterized protein [Dermacentor andersoni]|uniref:uncharacterized protein n=1 Tax=Dermacentor andersoni TaxID=34620 RepID=UPI002417A957|nr:uncharacterized protein LOC129382925 [Dermacentor andersoni]